MFAPRHLLIAAFFFVAPLCADEGNSAMGKTDSTLDPALRPIQADPNLPNVLLIGDSISIGYTLPVRDLLQGKANVHRPAINCGATSRGLTALASWLGATKWDVIHFNWGLHDLKYVEGKQNIPPDQYEKNLKEIVSQLKKTRAVLIWASTTPVPQSISSTKARVSSDVPAYNAIAERIMQENGIAMDDLYSFALPRLGEIQIRANVHYTPEGSKVLAGQVAKSIETELRALPAHAN